MSYKVVCGSLVIMKNDHNKTAFQGMVTCKRIKLIHTQMFYAH